MSQEEADEDNKNTPKGRRKIRGILNDEHLRAETLEALREEEERRKRLAEREKQREELREVSHSIWTELVFSQNPLGSD